MKKFILPMLGIAMGMGVMTSSDANAKCGEVSVAEMNWASGTIITSIATFLLEQGYGCDVTVVPSSTVPVVASIAENGTPDFAPELWVNSAPQYLELEAQGKVITASQVFEDGGQEGWWIPKYVTEANPGLKLDTIEGVMANADVVGGRFHNCPVGWGCRVANDNLKVALDLEGAMEVFDHGSGETLAASIAEAYADKAPWFGYYWGPTAILGKYPMTKVRIGEVNPDIHSCNQTTDCANPRVSDYPAAPVINVVTTSLKNREPEVAEFASKFTFPNAVLSDVLAWHEDNNASPDEAATYFITTYKDVWVNWINNDAKKNLAALIN